ncbi:MAG: Nucleoside triphosphate pyrophosphohydrolase [Firmicutes bacterium ADurb.Bin373]|nr:MAG: Nucleoside triphosphate pyrophosphohydrolase [Firmicutes bacterium ADurb.Bin373]
MPSHAKITIAGLGPGAPGGITLGVWESLKSSPRVLLRTCVHPVAEWLQQAGITFTTFDYLYEEEPDFQRVYNRIAAEVLADSQKGEVLYAVPGHPLVAEESVRLIIAMAESAGINIEILPAVSFLDSLFAALRLDPGAGLQVVDGLRLDERPPLAGLPAVITQVYSRLVAADIKISLLDIYPPEHQVTVIKGAGIPGEERIQTISLFELDRLSWLDHLTSLYVPALVDQTLALKQAGVAELDPGETDAPVVMQIYEDESGIFSAGTESKNQDCRYPLDPLVEILARLRGENGCPWDREQDQRSLRRYLIEETYEVLEAIDEGDTYKICEELGDLLLQIVFHAQIAAENQDFDMNNVVAGISEKMIRRHPHVFGCVNVRDSSEVLVNWEKIKAEERAGDEPASILAGVSQCFPALLRAAKLQEKAAGAGFDWPDYRGALEKVHEEMSELETVIITGDPVKIENELGDVLFSIVNLARLLGVEPESALTGTSVKFTRRFNYVEKMARLSGRDLLSFSLSELDKWWEDAKKLEKI